MEIRKKWPKFILQAEAVESAVVMKGGSARDIHIMIGNKINVDGYEIDKIIITEEALQDYGKISPAGNLIIDMAETVFCLWEDFRKDEKKKKR